MLTAIVAGTLLTVVCVVIHATGTSWWLVRLNGRHPEQPSHIRTLCASVAVLLGLHILEALCWAVVYFMIPNAGHRLDFEEAVYFSCVTFSSLGYGDVVLQGSLRLLSAFQSMAGLLMFGWSTAMLVTIVQGISRENTQNERKHGAQ